MDKCWPLTICTMLGAVALGDGCAPGGLDQVTQPSTSTLRTLAPGDFWVFDSTIRVTGAAGTTVTQTRVRIEVSHVTFTDPAGETVRALVSTRLHAEAADDDSGELFRTELFTQAEDGTYFVHGESDASGGIRWVETPSDGRYVSLRSPITPEDQIPAHDVFFDDGGGFNEAYSVEALETVRTPLGTFAAYPVRRVHVSESDGTTETLETTEWVFPEIGAPMRTSSVLTVERVGSVTVTISETSELAATNTLATGVVPVGGDDGLDLPRTPSSLSTLEGHWRLVADGVSSPQVLVEPDDDLASLLRGSPFIPMLGPDFESPLAVLPEAFDVYHYDASGILATLSNCFDSELVCCVTDGEIFSFVPTFSLLLPILDFEEIEQGLVSAFPPDGPQGFEPVEGVTGQWQAIASAASVGEDLSIEILILIEATADAEIAAQTVDGRQIGPISAGSSVEITTLYTATLTRTTDPIGDGFADDCARVSELRDADMDTP